MIIQFLKRIFPKQCDHSFKIIEEITNRDSQGCKKTTYVLKCEKCSKKSSFQK